MEDEKSLIKDKAAFENIVDISTSILKLQYIPSGWKTCLILAEATSDSAAIEQVRGVRNQDIREAKVISVTNTEDKEQMEMFLERYKDSGIIEYFIRNTKVNTYLFKSWNAPCCDLEYRPVRTDILHLHHPTNTKLRKKEITAYQELLDLDIQREFLTHRTDSFIKRKVDKDLLQFEVNPEKIDNFTKGLRLCYVFYDFTINEIVNFMNNVYHAKSYKFDIDIFCIDTKDASKSLYRIFMDNDMTIKRIS